MKTRSDISHEEATRDPIFLLQERVVIPNQDCVGEYDNEVEAYRDISTDKILDDDDLINNGWAAVMWRTVTVFLTREEGESFAEQTSYRYGRGRKNVDWMVYCVPCEGELAKLLKRGLDSSTEKTILDLLRLHGVFYDSLDSIAGGIEKLREKK